MNSAWILVLGAFAFSGPVIALQPLSEFLSSARTQSPEAIAQELRELRDEHTVRESFHRFFPTITMNLSYQRLIDGTVGLFPAQQGSNSILPSQNNIPVVLSGTLPLNQWGLSAQTNVPLINPRTWLEYARAKGALSVTESQALEAELRISERVAEAYFQLVAVLAETQVARLQDQLNRSMLLQIEAQTQLGDRTQDELEEFVNQIELANARRLNAEETLQATASRLFRLSQIEPELIGAGAPEWSFEPEPPVNEWIALSENHPVLRTGAERASSARREARLSRFEWLPELNGTFGYQGSTLFTPGFAGGVTLSMQFDFSRLPRRDALQAEARAQEMELLTLRQEVEENVRAAHMRVHQLIRLGRAIQSEGRFLNRRLSRARSAMFAGSATNDSYFLAMQSRFNNKLLEVQNRVELAYARILLRLTVGLSFPSRSPL